MQDNVCTLVLGDESDVGAARRRARNLAEAQGLSPNQVEALATAISEIARNVIVHAGRGELLLRLERSGDRRAIVAVASDDGPGIESLDDAMRDGYSTRNSLGLGLPSARRLVDEFEIRSAPGQGTIVVLKMWATHSPTQP
ncbi:MAG TPA: anti-sigma regulatory factor [Polyangiaceae bacterium]|jgi:serine/threonine-protein kinase RsbT|nr:anti-sigma regulatory factor [Polyangiaceae bacterium]